MTPKIQTFFIGYIGHKATELQNLFYEFPIKENENGFFLEFVNFTELVNNLGVYAVTNCFEDENHFKERLYIKLLSKL